MAMISKFLTGRVALVTGSTSGLGEGIARCLANRGASIILTGLGNESTISQILKSIKSEHQVDAVYVGGDLTKTEDVNSLYTESLKKFPDGIDILVNNAGFQHVSPIETFPLEIFHKMMTIMLSASFQLTQLSIGRMKEKGWGRIVNMSSAHGHVASPNKTAYVTCKHGLVGFTKTLGIEVAGTGVTCNAVCPGYVETPLFLKQAEDISKNQGISFEDGKKKILSVHPSREPVKIEQVAEIVSFLCSSAADQMTGSSLIIDGGWTAQ